jgi:Uma2 family endonuclease
LNARIIRLLDAALAGRCTVMTSDAKVRVETSDFAAFPDASVVCGERLTSRIDAHALINPTLLVEVTSRSTEAYDRGDKLAHYQSLPSLQAVLFVSHRERRLTLVSRDAGRWLEQDFENGEVGIHEPHVRFSVADVYEGIDLDPA